jgi:preprotein translocase subunit YajC
MFLITNAYAMGAGPAAGQEGNLFAGLMPFILIFVVFYFLLIRPQQKKAKEHKQMLQALQKGDAVITAGGLYGRIVETRDDVVVLDLGETKVTVGRGYIAGVPAKAQAAAAPKREKKGKESKARELPDESKPAAEEDTAPQEAKTVEGGPAETQVVEGGGEKDDK